MNSPLQPAEPTPPSVPNVPPPDHAAPAAGSSDAAMPREWMLARRTAELPAPIPLVEITSHPHLPLVYRMLRERWGPVVPVKLEDGPHGPVTAHLVLDYQMIVDVARDERRWSCDPRDWRDLNDGRVAADSGLAPMMFFRPNVYFVNGSLRRRWRAALDDSLDGLHTRPNVKKLIRAVCTDRLLSLAHRGQADLVADYAAPIPMLTVAALFGIDIEQGTQLHDALIALFSSGADGADSQAGNAIFERVLTGVLRARQACPADPATDLTTAFLRHPNLESEAEVLQHMVVTVSAGYETLKIWIARTLLLMLSDPRFASRIRGGSLGLDDALDDVLWDHSPMEVMPARYALTDCRLGDQQVRAGDAVVLGFGAANADPAVRTSDPWSHSGNRAHLSWSVGPHRCPAPDLARLIARTAVDLALRHLPGLALTTPPDQIPLLKSPWTRCPATLPVRFDETANFFAPTRSTAGGHL